MKLSPLFVCLTALVVTTHVFGEERAASFDAAAARATLTQEVKQPKFLIKSAGPDPVVKRFYTKDAVVVTRQSGAKQENPYVPVPLLFRVNTGELLDVTSRDNVVKLAQLLKDLGAQKATFSIEGHASAEGDEPRNQELSELRALRIQSLLRDQGVPAGVVVRTEGFGSKHAEHAAAEAEDRRQEDRRVLVVRER